MSLFVILDTETYSMATLLDMIDSNNNVRLVISDCTAGHCKHLQYMVKGMTISSILPTAVYISRRETGTPRITEDAKITPEELTKSHTILYLELGFEILIIDTMKRIAKIANSQL